MGKYLIVVDMQNDFIDGSLGTKEAEKIVFKVIEKIKHFEGNVFFTQDTHQENYLSTQEGNKLPIKHCMKGTIGWEIHPMLKPYLPEKTFCKNTFGSKELAEFFKSQSEKEKIEEIELIGLCTDICVISNALLLKAFLPETRIAVDASCCAGVSPESHIRALEAMKVCQIEIKEE